LNHAIGRLDLEAADRLLTAEPALARQTLETAASRDNATSWYFKRIGHYAFGGDRWRDPAASSSPDPLLGGRGRFAGRRCRCAHQKWKWFDCAAAGNRTVRTRRQRISASQGRTCPHP
jgi:hypothetical protein